MKNITLRPNRSLLLAVGALLALSLFGGASQLQAYDGRHDGYRGGYGHSHHYEYYHHHRGYWNEGNGGRIWINIG